MSNRPQIQTTRAVSLSRVTAVDSRQAQRGKALCGVALVAIVLGTLVVGCATARRSIASVDVDAPRVSLGFMDSLSATDEDWRGITRSFDQAWILDLVEKQQRSMSMQTVLLAQAQNPSATPDSTPPAVAAAQQADQQFGEVVEIPKKMSHAEIHEIIEALKLNWIAENGFQEVNKVVPGVLPSMPANVEVSGILVRPHESGQEFVRVGYQKFITLFPRIWVQAVIWNTESGVVTPSALLDSVPAELESLQKDSDEMKKGLTLDDLAFQIVQLSYIDVSGAMEALHSLGVSTNRIESAIAFDQLPIVTKMPSPDESQTQLLGSEIGADAAAFGLSVSPSVASKLPFDTNVSPSTRLLIHYHPAHPEQMGHVRSLLKNFIDRPARQIFVEGMVMEISEEGMKELGIEWQFEEGNLQLLINAATTGGAGFGDLSMLYDTAQDFQEKWTVKLKALVVEGKAEILSRPSVLTLNNRQATIRVGTDIPIATSQEGAQGTSNKISFNFKYLPTGISLNVRPRITESGEEVSMLIDTIVSAVVPEADLELRSSSGQVLASAPTVSSRRIQTYARIANNTPFIIGGLVSREVSVIRKKVPLLGDIPWLGVLFRSKRSESTKREVIIVLTPHVMPDQEILLAGRHLPKDVDDFDEFGNQLFRDTYRIRQEDIFDLQFLRNNERLLAAWELARKAIDRNSLLAESKPFSQFADKHVPGERIIVHRMIYELIKRLSKAKQTKDETQWLDQYVQESRLILFSTQNLGGFEVKFLVETLSQLGDGVSVQSFFTRNPGKALALTFNLDKPQAAPGFLETNPVPEISLYDCPDRERWGQLLWDLNQPDPEGNRRSTILIQSPEDLLRLRRAVMTKKIVQLNGGGARMELTNYSVGRMVLMPEPKPTQTHLIDPDVADFFFHSEHYYASTLQEMEMQISELEKIIATPQFQWLREAR